MISHPNIETVFALQQICYQKKIIVLGFIAIYNYIQGTAYHIPLFF